MNWIKAKQMYDLLISGVCVADLSQLPDFSVIYSLSVSVCVDMFTNMYPKTCLTAVTCSSVGVQ